jgi:hypothetical protein
MDPFYTNVEDAATALRALMTDPDVPFTEAAFRNFLTHISIAPVGEVTPTMTVVYSGSVTLADGTVWSSENVAVELSASNGGKIAVINDSVCGAFTKVSTFDDAIEALFRGLRPLEPTARVL